MHTHTHTHNHHHHHHHTEYSRTSFIKTTLKRTRSPQKTTTKKQLKNKEKQLKRGIVLGHGIIHILKWKVSKQMVFKKEREREKRRGLSSGWLWRVPLYKPLSVPATTTWTTRVVRHGAVGLLHKYTALGRKNKSQISPKEIPQASVLEPSPLFHLIDGFCFLLLSVSAIKQNYWKGGSRK